MKKYILLIATFGIFGLSACSDTNTKIDESNENNKSTDSNLSYPEVEEKYKIITVPIVQRQDLEQ